MKKLIYIVFFYSSFFLSQISLQVKLVNKSYEIDGKRLLEITISNESHSRYALPIDTMDFKPFYSGEYCVDFVNPESYEDVMLKANFENQIDNEIVMAIPQFKLMGQIDENDKRVIMELNKRNSRMKLQNKELDRWKKHHQIVHDKDWVIKNKFLFSSFIFLEPGQKIIYQKYFNPKKINFNRISETYDYYKLLSNESYRFSLKYCIDGKIYDYLTEKQKIKLKDFNLFIGNLESNILVWE